MSTEQPVEVSKYLLDRSIKYNDYCAITGQFHIDPFQLGGDPAEKGGIFLEGTLDYAQQMDVPILSAQEWLNFTDIRHDTDFINMDWDTTASTLTFNLLPHNPADATLTVLLPMRAADKSTSTLDVDGVTTSYPARLVIGSVEYIQVILSAQEHAIKVTYL